MNRARNIATMNAVKKCLEIISGHNNENDYNGDDQNDSDNERNKSRG